MNLETEINPRQLAILLDVSNARAISHFFKADPDAKREQFEKLERDWFVSIRALTLSTGLDLLFLIEDTQKNFCKNKQCVDYAVKAVQQKIKKNARGFYPLKIYIPREITWIITEEQRIHLRQMINDALPQLWIKEGQENRQIQVV